MSTKTVLQTENTRVGIADCPYCKTEAEVEAFNKARAVLNKKRETENARVGIADCPYC